MVKLSMCKRRGFWKKYICNCTSELIVVVIGFLHCLWAFFFPFLPSSIQQGWIIFILRVCVCVCECVCVRTCVLSCFIHVKLFATLWTIAFQVPLSMGFPRQEFLSGLPFPSPGYLPDPGIKSMSPALQVDFCPLSHLGNPILQVPSFNYYSAV